MTFDKKNSPWLNDYEFELVAIGENLSKYGFSHKAVKWLRLNSSKYDFVIVHGIWQYHSLATYFALKGTDIPYYVYIHGALDPWFKKYYPLKHLKKFIYWILFEYKVLKSSRSVLFTSEEEKLLASKSFTPYSFKEEVVGFGKEDHIFKEKDKNKLLQKYPVLKNKKVLLYVSRMHQKKGYDILVKAFYEIADKYPDYYLVMMGPDPENIKIKYERKVPTKLKSRIIWTGWVETDIKWSAYYCSEAYVLSSHSENWGATVVESLISGTPVLLSNKVNIWREVINSEAGLVDNDSISGTKSNLIRWINLNDKTKKQYGINSRKCYEKNFTNLVAAKKLIDIVSKNV